MAEMGGSSRVPGVLGIVGGSSNDGSNGGLSALNLNNTLGNSNWNYGARVTFMNLMLIPARPLGQKEK